MNDDDPSNCDSFILDKLAAPPRPHHPSTKPLGNEAKMRARFREKVTAWLDETRRRHVASKDILSQLQPKKTDNTKRSKTSSMAVADGESCKAMQMAHILEEHLFRESATWEECQDERTLPRRLQSAVNQFRRKRASWQRKKHDDHLRRAVINLTQGLIAQRMPRNGDGKRLKQRVPLMAQRLEEILCREAKTREECADTATLPARLQNLAMKCHKEHEI